MTTATDLGTAKGTKQENGRTVALGGDQIARLRAAVEDGFTLDELRQLLATGLDDNLSLSLDMVVAVEGRTRRDICHDLVLWALHDERVGLQGLLAASLRANPTNSLLQKLKEEWAGIIFTAPECPYPGMRPFTAAEQARFYGRDAEIERAVDRLRRHPFLAVIGPSGSGKSSLLAAGIVPELEKSHYFADKRWIVRTMRPGTKPFDMLGRVLDLPADALGMALNGKVERLPGLEEGARLLLVVDQYEELFTVAGAKQRKQFEQALLRLTDMQDVYVILAARADFYANLMTSPLWPAMNQHRLEITPPQGDALRQAIALPARDVGVELEAELVERLLADAGDEPGVLPFIQETLVMLWVHADKFTIGLAPYTNLVGDKSGRSGLQVALAEHAEHVYRDELVNDGERSVAARILLRLIQFGEGRADTRRQQTVDDLRKGTSQDTDFDHVLAVLTANRLLTLSDEERRVDLSHETLIRGRPRLNEWIDQRRAAELTRRRLEEKAGERRRLRQQDEAGGLLDAVELTEAEAWVKRADAPELGVSEELGALVDDSRRAIDAAAHEKAEAAQRELEQARKLVEERTEANRKLRRRAQVALAVGALALVAAAIAIFSYANAQSEAQNARKAEATARKAEATAVAEASARSRAQAETAEQLSRTQIGESRLLNTLAEQQLTQDPVAAIHLSVRALPSVTVTRPLVTEAQATLAQALRTSQERRYRPLLSDEVLARLYLIPKQVAFQPAQSAAAGAPGLIVATGDQLYIVDSELISVTSGELSTGNLLSLAWGDDDKLLVTTANRVDIWQGRNLLTSYPPANASRRRR